MVLSNSFNNSKSHNVINQIIIKQINLADAEDIMIIKVNLITILYELEIVSIILRIKINVHLIIYYSNIVT